MKKGKWIWTGAIVISCILSIISYAGNGFVFEDSDTRILSEYDVQGMPAKALRLAINEIYARHGRIYETTDLKEYFSSQPWYSPISSSDNFDEDKVFNSIEKENIKFLSKKKDDVTKEEALDAIEKKYRNRDFIIAKSGMEELTKADIGSLTAEELMLASGDPSHSESGQKSQSESDQKSHYN